MTTRTAAVKGVKTAREMLPESRSPTKVAKVLCAALSGSPRTSVTAAPAISTSSSASSWVPKTDHQCERHNEIDRRIALTPADVLEHHDRHGQAGGDEEPDLRQDQRDAEHDSDGDADPAGMRERQQHDDPAKEPERQQRGERHEQRHPDDRPDPREAESERLLPLGGLAEIGVADDAEAGSRDEDRDEVGDHNLDRGAPEEREEPTGVKRRSARGICRHDRARRRCERDAHKSKKDARGDGYHESGLGQGEEVGPHELDRGVDALARSEGPERPRLAVPTRRALRSGRGCRPPAFHGASAGRRSAVSVETPWVQGIWSPLTASERGSSRPRVGLCGAGSSTGAMVLRRSDRCGSPGVVATSNGAKRARRHAAERGLLRLVQRARPQGRARRPGPRPGDHGHAPVRVRDVGAHPGRPRPPDQGDRPRERLLPPPHPRVPSETGGRARGGLRPRARRRHPRRRAGARGAARGPARPRRPSSASTCRSGSPRTATFRCS